MLSVMPFLSGMPTSMTTWLWSIVAGTVTGGGAVEACDFSRAHAVFQSEKHRQAAAMSLIVEIVAPPRERSLSDCSHRRLRDCSQIPSCIITGLTLRI